MKPFTGVKVFSVTKAVERRDLPLVFDRWREDHPNLEIVEQITLQSSDTKFHCLSLVIFFRERSAGEPSPPG